MSTKEKATWGFIWLGVLACAAAASLVGCTLPSPTPPIPDVVKIPAPSIDDDEAILAIELAEEQLDDANTPDITPTPNVKVGDTCPNCQGRGTSGDGIQKCIQCNGDGRVDEGDEILNPTERSIVVPPLTRAEFEDLENKVFKLEEFYVAAQAKVASIAEMKDATVEHVQCLNELRAMVLSLQEKEAARTKEKEEAAKKATTAKSVPSPKGQWVTKPVQVTKCRTVNGRKQCYTTWQNQNIWVPTP